MFGLIFACALILLIGWIYLRLTFWQRRRLPQCLLHSVNSIRGVMHLVDQELVINNGKVVGTYEILTPNLIVVDPVLVNEILVKNFHKFADHRKWLPDGVPYSGSLFFLPYLKWKSTRSILSPIFTSSNLKKMQPLMVKSIDQLMLKLKPTADDGGEIDIQFHIENCIIDVTFRTILGTAVDSSSDQPTNPIVKIIKLIFGSDISLMQIIAFAMPELTYKLSGQTALNIDSIRFLADLSERIINDRLENDQTTGLKHKDILQQMLDCQTIDGKEDRKNLTKTEIIHNTVLFILAGYDTTLATLKNIIYCLAKNPDAQERVAQELRHQIKLSDDIDLDQLTRLPILDAFINESQRLLPAVVRVERRAVEDVDLGSVSVSKGMYVTMPIYAIHRDPNNYDNPDEFIIDRFIAGNRTNIKAGSFLPFADGPKNCIGYRFALVMVKLCLAKLISNYRIVATANTKYEPLKGRIVLSSRNVIVKIENRD